MTCSNIFHDNRVFTFLPFESYSLDSLMEKFRALVPEAASVIRDGVMKPLPATEIVIGDIIRLKSGD